MSSRDKILAAVSQNQPVYSPVPDISFLQGDNDNTVAKFVDILTTIGGKVILAETIADVRFLLLEELKNHSRKVTTVPLLGDIMEMVNKRLHDPHTMENIDYAVIEADLAVAENGAVWVTEDKLFTRVLPFICQHLAVIVKADNVVPTMHEAYQKIGDSTYGFGTFIAGPSKTADIEQSLVLGAHGARSLTVFLLS